MAASYRVATQYPTVEFLGGAVTRAVMAVGYVTIPSGVYFEVRIPQAQYNANEVGVQGVGHADAIEQVMALPHVAGVTWQQSAKPDGTLADEAEVYITSTSGNSSASFVIPFGYLGVQPYTNDHIDPLVQQLDAAEAL